MNTSKIPENIVAYIAIQNILKKQSYFVKVFLIIILYI